MFARAIDNPANGTATMASAVQSYGVLSVTSASGCIKQAANVAKGTD